MKTPEMKRCEPCLGMGYKGRDRNGRWKLETCRACRGSGQVEKKRRQAKRKLEMALPVLALVLSGCAVMPDRARVELSHDSHATAGRTGCNEQCAEDGLSRASLILKWQHGPLTIEAGEGWNLRGRNGGGFYGPGEVFTGRIGYEFNLKGR